MSAASNITKKFQFVGGQLCLDFTNTVGARDGLKREYLTSYGDFISWCRQAGLLGPSQANVLLQVAARRSDESSAALRRAVTLREAIYRIFEALASGKTPRSPDVEELNAALAASLGRLRLVAGAKGFGWTWMDA